MNECHVGNILSRYVDYYMSKFRILAYKMAPLTQKIAHLKFFFINVSNLKPKYQDVPCLTACDPLPILARLSSLCVDG